jgi:PAS domain S-box-containing protein
MFLKEKKNITNVTFFIIAMACGMWEFSMGMMNISVGFNNHIVAYVILITTIIILPASVIYMFSIADFPPLVIKIHIIVLGLLAIVTLFSLFFSYSPECIDRFWGESVSYANLKKNVMTKVYQYQLICGLIFISGCIAWSKKERLKRVKTQIKFFYLYVALVVFAFMISILIPALFRVSSNPLGSIYMFAGFVALTYYSNKTRAFSFSMESISNDIMKNVVMPLIVLDGDGELIIANKAATCLFGLSVEDLKKVSYESLFTEESMKNYHKTEGICLSEEGEGNLVIRNGNIPVKVTSTIMRDEFNDILYSLSYFTDFSKEQELMDKLEESRMDAENANKAKGDFLANMSHEIRTPINAVLGLDEMIIRECKDEDIRTYAFDIKSAGKTLLGLVNDVLDFSKIESNKMEIIPVEYELSSVINDLLNMITVKTSEKKLIFEIDVAETIPHLLYGDEIRIKQVILNILTNAVKYTEKGSVALSFGYEEADEDFIYLVVKVKDTGIGIRKEDMQMLFSPFERIDEKKNRTVEGTGLGMSITTQILIMMGSQLEVDSVYGEGSVFSFRLKQRVIDWKQIGNFAQMYNRIREEGEKYKESFRAPEAKCQARCRGLLRQTERVDRQERVRRLARGALRRERQAHESGQYHHHQKDRRSLLRDRCHNGEQAQKGFADALCNR